MREEMNKGSEDKWRRKEGSEDKEDTGKNKKSEDKMRR